MSEQENASQINTEGASNVSNDKPSTETPHEKEERDLSETFYGKDGDDNSDEKSGETGDKKDVEEEPEGDSKDEVKADAESDSEEKKADEKDDDDYALDDPEDSYLEKSDMERIAAFAKERGLSKDDAQKIVEFENEAKADFAFMVQDKHRELVDGWKEASQTDKEFGGEKLQDSVKLSNMLLSRFGNEDLNKFIRESGFGSHPEVIRFLTRIGRTMAPDELKVPSAASSGERSIEEIFYGKQD